MKDPYKEVFEEIGNAFQKVNKLIFELASRSLSVKEYKEFVETVNKKENKEAKDETESGTEDWPGRPEA